MGRTGGASYAEDQNTLDALKKIIRVGTVQSYDAVTRLARVKFDDKNGMKSAP